MATLFLSDLHLPAGASPLRDAFAGFLEGTARSAEQVFILGDLFEYWIGDDAGLQTYAREISRIAALSALKVPVYFMHGNRDFLVDGQFAQVTGAHILPDPYVLNLYGTPTLVSHGDLFCTDDLAYQRWRRFSRNRLAQRLFCLLPQAGRQKIAGGLRAQSDGQKRYKPEDIMDVNEHAISTAFPKHGVQCMIHGHTHRPAEHRYDIAGRLCERIVLADWRPGRMEYLRVDENSCVRIAL